MAKRPSNPATVDYVGQPHLSYDGRYVLFASRAQDILPGMPPPGSFGTDRIYTQWYLHDRQLKTTERISVNNQGVPQQGPMNTPMNPARRDVGARGIDISRDGRFVVFDSDASNLVPNDNNGTSDVFLHDRVTRKLTKL
jgi:hypothetical protein